MTTVLIAIAAICLGLGYWVGRQSPAPSVSSCPRCRQQRLYYCRGCGHHFDEDDAVIDPREYERMTELPFGRDELDS